MPVLVVLTSPKSPSDSNDFYYIHQVAPMACIQHCLSDSKLSYR